MLRDAYCTYRLVVMYNSIYMLFFIYSVLMSMVPSNHQDKSDSGSAFESASDYPLVTFKLANYLAWASDSASASASASKHPMVMDTTTEALKHEQEQQLQMIHALQVWHV